MQKKNRNTRKESWWSKQQYNTPSLRVVHGIRLWFLPGVSEVGLEMIPAPGDVRFGMDIQRTEEVTDPICSVFVFSFNFFVS